MMLEVSLDTLTRSKITAHQFLVCKLLHDKKFNELEQYLELTNSKATISTELNYLESLKFIAQTTNDVSKDINNVKILPSFIKEVTNGNFFEELLDAYPILVIRDGGIKDYLRAERYNSKKLYEMIAARNRSKHEHILKCLRAEIEHREREGSMKYMKRLYKWLLTKEWMSYEERVRDSENAALGKEVRYGTELE